MYRYMQNPMDVWSFGGDKRKQIEKGMGIGMGKESHRTMLSLPY